MTAWDAIPLIAALFAVLPALLFLRNLQLFRPPRGAEGYHPAISVLIPARNEAGSIRACLEHLSKSEGVTLEIIVLDDHSTDNTAAIVEAYARETDNRVSLKHAPELPPGWSGKQYACYVLSQHAHHDLFCFLDADVRLQSHALWNLASFQQSTQAQLVSGFPYQETVTLLEQLLIPLINWLLLCYLPIDRMRKDLQPGLGAGCGQWFLTTRDAYNRVGGHQAVQDSFHDGVKLPRAYRRAGLMTDLCDATQDATCRMYRNAGQVWNGLAKNAREGLGAPKLLIFWTILLFSGHVLPFLQWLLLPWYSGWGIAFGAAATMLTLLPRVMSAIRFRQSWLSVLLHPLGVMLLLAIQWYANVRHWLGKPIGWKGRAQPVGARS